eukprot:TRINITY_DN992_c0_g1_i4.p1 TRINITY_DN992_c0_g1~~TRINITY_DN992_c0_g1_i4.p1  ORF type:complete len:592 (-),score=136.18 TRINITY_DN992_c0_g1_i4:586-2331(-)
MGCGRCSLRRCLGSLVSLLLVLLGHLRHSAADIVSGTPKRQRHEQDIENEELEKEMVPDITKAINHFLQGLSDKYGERYNLNLFSNGWHDLPDGGQAILERMLGAIVHQRNFHMSFTGISVTAGHDNLKEQAYPWQFGEIMGPIFAHAGVNFTSSNGAMGNNGILPYSYCMEAHAGSHPDIVSWEMGMMVEGTPCFPKSEFLEYWIRNVVALPSQPIPVVLEAVSTRRWCPGNRDLTYYNYDFNQMFGRCFGDHPSVQERHKDHMEYYKEFGIHAMHLDALLSQNTCDDDQFDVDHLYGNKVGTPFIRNWHPGPRGHRLMAETLAANYLHLLLPGLKHLSNAAPGLKRHMLEDEEYVSSLAAKLDLPPEPARWQPLPMPNFCTLEQCVKAGSYNCLTSYYPNLEESLQLKNHVTQSNFNGTERTAYLPQIPEEWEMLLNEPTWEIHDFDFHNTSYPIDRKWVLAGDKRSGSVNIQFTTERVSTNSMGHAWTSEPIVVCRQLPPQQLDEEKAAQHIDSISNMWFMIDSKPSGASRMPPDFGDRSVCWTLDERVGNGDHLLTITPLKEGAENLVRISHVIVPK